MTATPKAASGAVARASAVDEIRPTAEAGPFVLNLCSSTTPMALARAESPELQRFSFFVSRRFEEGRERFRLHMGYFTTLAEAEEWLNVVRDIYPGAWAGEAPGKKLRERAAAAAAAQGPAAPVSNTLPGSSKPSAPAVPVAPPAQQAAVKPPAPAISGPRATRGSDDLSPMLRAMMTVPTVQPSPNAIPELDIPTVHAASPAPELVPPTVSRAPASKAPAVSKPAAEATSASKAPAVSKPAAEATPASKAPAVSKPAAAAVPKAVSSPNKATPPAVRAALGQGTGPGTAAARPMTPTAAMIASTRAAVAPAQPSAAGRVSTQQDPQSVPRTPAAAARAQTLPANARSNVPTASAAPLKGKAPAPSSQRKPPGKPAKPLLPNSNVREVLAALDESTGETRMMPAPAIASMPEDGADSALTDTQVLKFLESRRSEGDDRRAEGVDTGAISLLKPDDTQTRRALKVAVSQNAPVSFAVQLQWSVQPVELSQVPPLAIFSAYTLYTVEGSRDGRKWYGLRLGFFSDAISAKQVAYYVRSEFNSVAVVPVSPQELERASDSDRKSKGFSIPKKVRQGQVDEFKLIDEPEGSSPQSADGPVKTAPVRAGVSAKGAAAPAKAGTPAKATPMPVKRKAGGRVRAREQAGPQTLEETLEILGASELEIDNGSGETLNESGVRHLRVEVQKNTPFSRLLERLSDRMKKG